MRPRRRVLRVSTIAALALGSCTVYDTDAPTDLPAARAPESRTALSFAAEEAFLLPAEDVPGGWDVSAPEPAADPKTWAAFFEDTGQVRVVAPRGDVHCALEFRRFDTGETASVFLSAITLTLLPGVTDGYGVLLATVSAADRAPVRYELRGTYTSWVWLPLLPVGIVQSFERGLGSPDTRPDLVRALVRRMLDDGFLDPVPPPRDPPTRG